MNKNGFDFFSYRLSIKEQTLFAKRLAFLIKAGIPLLDALRMLSRQAKSKSHKRIFENIIKDVSSGQFLATSLGKFKNAFGDFAVNIIRVGELTGILDQNLSYLAEELKKKHAMRKKILGAMIYPIFVTIATMGLTAILTVYIFPKVLPIFKSLNVHLPFTTRTLIFASSILQHYGLLIIAAIVFVIILIMVLKNMHTKFRFMYDRVILRLPLSGNIAQNYNLTNIARTLSLLLKSGVRVVEAITITGETTANTVYRAEILKAAKYVTRGAKIFHQFETRKDLFPDTFTEMIAIGESAGNLPETLMYLADMYETEVDESTKNLSSSIEPFLMIFMGLVVGFIAISIITPIYEVTQNLTL